MKVSSICLVALIAAGCMLSSVSAEVNCGNLTAQGACNAESSSCSWTPSNSGNCDQSILCSDVPKDSCLDNDHKNFCQITGTCSTNTQTCALSATGACDTANGCNQVVNSCTAKGDWQCGALIITKGQQCTDQKDYCMNSPVTVTYNGTMKCSATVTTAANCNGPCTAGAFTCASICNPSASEADCTKDGCTYSADGKTCAPAQACSSFTDSNSCNAANTGCSGSFACAAPSNYNDYCTNNAANYDTDANVSKYCNQNYNCESNPNYCDKTNNTICPIANNNAQCEVDVNCVNPQKDQCELQNTKAGCPAGQLCTWAYTSDCSNQTTNQTCNGKKDSETDCKTLSATGCAWIQGGTCSTKTSGGSSSHASALVAFSAVILSLVFTL